MRARGIQNNVFPRRKSALATIGLKPINVFDYIEDYVNRGEPDWETFLLVAAARRDYFLHEQNGEWSQEMLDSSELPPKLKRLKVLNGCHVSRRKQSVFSAEGSVATLCTAAVEIGIF